MPHKVLQLAKLTRPRLHGTVARERLFVRLDEERERRAAICIVGPPGAGKTALTASWLDSRRVRGIWYQVDSSDADLGTLFYYLREGSSIFAGRGQRPLPLLTPEYLPDVPAFSRRFFRELFLRLPQGASLVLDNYQEVAPDQLLHRLVADAAGEAPQGTTIVLISRRDPPDCYARLRANERVALVTWPELKLSLDEAVAIAKTRGVVDRDRVQAIYSRADGWAAGMMLLLEQAKTGQEDTSATSAGGKATFGYFASQIFDQLIERDRKILLCAAVFPTVTVQLARDISGEAAAGEGVVLAVKLSSVAARMPRSM
jgi:ATP/maltotriose-dependent transcriptional regulator MalT